MGPWQHFPCPSYAPADHDDPDGEQVRLDLAAAVEEAGGLEGFVRLIEERRRQGCPVQLPRRTPIGAPVGESATRREG